MRIISLYILLMITLSTIAIDETHKNCCKQLCPGWIDMTNETKHLEQINPSNKKKLDIPLAQRIFAVSCFILFILMLGELLYQIQNI